MDQRHSLFAFKRPLLTVLTGPLYWTPEHKCQYKGVCHLVSHCAIQWTTLNSLIHHDTHLRPVVIPHHLRLVWFIASMNATPSAVSEWAVKCCNLFFHSNIIVIWGDQNSDVKMECTSCTKQTTFSWLLQLELHNLIVVVKLH